MRWLFSVRTQMVIALTLSAAVTALLWWLLTNHQHTWVNWVACWLGVINVMSFGYYGFDKYLARRVVVSRIPEIVLHTLAAIGGSPAALVAMWLFRHKTIKGSFRIVFWCIVVVQTALAVYIVKVVWWT